MTTLARPARQRRSIVPWLFPAGLGLVVLVNMVLLWFALDTFPGVATRNAYERGRNYGRVLDRDTAIAGLGWRVDIRFLSQGEGVIAVRYEDRDGKPITGLRPHTILTRPVGVAIQVEVHLREVDAGLYQADVALPHRGQWDAQVTADAASVPHVAAARLNVR
ncbi:MAG TPA: FixH family protein [Vineibacter sp.]|nr:FixH family protein [Vineibacter sp.]